MVLHRQCSVEQIILLRIIDGWIAELGLSSRRFRRRQDPQLAPAGADASTARPGRGGRQPSAPALTPARSPLAYRVISSPC